MPHLMIWHIIGLYDEGMELPCKWNQEVIRMIKYTHV